MDQPLLVNILLAEYRELYGLVVFRMTSLERRAPIAGAALAGFLASVGVMPSETRLIFLLGLPVALVWFLRTTTNHARSFEDLLRRIQEIERELNECAGKTLVAFQSQHPSRGRSVGGRTGGETTHAVLVTCLIMLLACGYLFTATAGIPDMQVYLYASYLTATAVYLIYHRAQLRYYRYQRQPSLTGP